MKKTALIMSVILIINLLSVNASATTKKDSTENTTERIIMPDLGVDLTPLSQETVNNINQIAKQMTALSSLCNEIEKMNISSSEKSSLKSIPSNQYIELREEIQKLGAVKLTKEQAMLYVNSQSGITNEASTNRASSVPGVNYPDIAGIEFYIFEYTVTFSDDPNDTMYEMANCIALPAENVNSKMVKIYEPLNLYEKTSIKNLTNKVVKMIAEELTDYLLSAATGGTISFPVSAIWDLAGDSLPSTNSTNEARLDLTVSTSSTIIHYWKKINGVYYFRLATCAALIRESWLLIDNTGAHKYKYHEFWSYSKYHRDGSDRRAIQASSAESYSIYLPYYVKRGTTYVPVLEVRPYHAGAPTHFATVS